MKSITNIFLPVLCLLAAACNKGTTDIEKSSGGESSEQEPVFVDGKLRMKVSVGKSTKAETAKTDEESKVNRLEVLVFRDSSVVDPATGKQNPEYQIIDAYGIDTLGKDNMFLLCAAGHKEVWAAVNCPSYDSLKYVANKAELMKKVSLFKDNGKTSFQMIGGTKFDLNEKSTEVKIPVKHIVSRVVIESITTDFAKVAPGLNNVKILLEEMYLTNDVTNFTFGNIEKDVQTPESYPDTSAYAWYNKLGYYEDKSAKIASIDSLTYEKGIDFQLRDGNVHTTAHCFYIYPNASKDTSSTGGETYTPRHSRLVLKTVVDPDGAKIVQYYPITLPIIESNKSYLIKKLVITRQGSEYIKDICPYPEDTPVDPISVNYQIKILDWEEILLGKEGVIEI